MQFEVGPQLIGRYLISYLGKYGLREFYEKPILGWFQSQINFLVRETLIVLVLALIWPNQIKPLYQLYSYLWLCHSVYSLFKFDHLIYLKSSGRLGGYFSNHPRRRLIWIYGVIYLGMRQLIHLCWTIELIHLALVIHWIWKNPEKIVRLKKIVYNLIYTNLNWNMRRYLFAYLGIYFLNLLSFSFLV